MLTIIYLIKDPSVLDDKIRTLILSISVTLCMVTRQAGRVILTYICMTLNGPYCWRVVHCLVKVSRHLIFHEIIPGIHIFSSVPGIWVYHILSLQYFYRGRLLKDAIPSMPKTLMLRFPTSIQIASRPSAQMLTWYKLPSRARLTLLRPIAATQRVTSSWKRGTYTAGLIM